MIKRIKNTSPKKTRLYDTVKEKRENMETAEVPTSIAKLREYLIFFDDRLKAVENFILGVRNGKQV